MNHPKWSTAVLVLVLAACAKPQVAPIAYSANEPYKAPPPRAEAVKLTTASPQGLEQTGYVELGKLAFRRVVRTCWQQDRGESCADESGHADDPIVELMRAAKDKGAELVRLSDPTGPKVSSEPVTKNGRCLELGTTRQPFEDCRSICEKMGTGGVCERQTQRCVSTMRDTLTCKRHETIHGRAETLETHATIWRLDPEGALAKQWEKALTGSDTDLLRQIAEKGKPFSSQRSQPWLVAAIHKRNKAAVQVLLDAHADPNASADESLPAPLSHAVVSHDAEIVRLLLKHGADPNLVDKRGNRIMTLAAGGDGDPQIVAALIAAGVKVDQVDMAAARSAARPDLLGVLSKASGYSSLWIRLPDGWKEKPLPPNSPNGVYHAFNEDGDVGLLLAVRKRDSTTNMLALAAAMRAQTITRLSGAQSSGIERLSVAARPACRFSVAGSLKNGIGMTYLVTLVEGPTEVAILNTWTPTARMRALRAPMQRLAEGIEF